MLMRVVLVATAVILVAGCGKHLEVIKEVDSLIAGKSYNQALDVLQKALREDPMDETLLRQQVLLFLHTEDVNYATAAYRRLDEAHPRNSILIDSVSHPEPVVRVTAAKALGYLKDAHAIQALSKATKDIDKSVRQAAVLALGDLKDPAAIPALVAALNDEYWYVRAEAALALGKIGDTHAATRLFSMLEDSDPYVRDNAREALQDLATEENKSAYLSALKSEVASTRLMAATALALAEDNSGTQILVAELGNHQSSELLSLIKAAGKLKDPALLPALRNLIDHENKEISANAILALGELKDKDSVNRIKAKLQSKSEPKVVKTSCLMALNLISK